VRVVDESRRFKSLADSAEGHHDMPPHRAPDNSRVSLRPYGVSDRRRTVFRANRGTILVAVAFASACGGVATNAAPSNQTAHIVTTPTGSAVALMTYLDAWKPVRTDVNAQVALLNKLQYTNTPNQTWVTAKRALRHLASHMSADRLMLAALKPPVGLAGANQAYLSALQEVINGVNALASGFQSMNRGTLVGDISAFKTDAHRGRLELSAWRVAVTHAAATQGVKLPTWVYRVR
jgi:hypothetical protein